MKIMLLEDDIHTSEALATILKLQGFAVDIYTDGRTAMDHLCDCYDAYIIDINVPSINGMEILKEVRRLNENVPAIVISAYSDIDTILKAYNTGCTDYLKKPFDARELKVKMEKLMAITRPEVVLDDTTKYDRMKKVLTVDGSEVALTKKEKNLLHLLIENRGCIVDHESIFSYVWPGVQGVKSDSLRSLVRRLRQKMPEELIKSIVGIGYKIE